MPMFIQAITTLGGTISRSGIWIYSLNMLGGVFWLWLVSTFLLEFCGARGSMFWAAAGNVVIRLTSFAVSGRVTNSTLEETAVDEQVDSALESAIDSVGELGKFKHIFLLAFASGAVVLASEVLTCFAHMGQGSRDYFQWSIFAMLKQPFEPAGYFVNGYRHTS